ncbi:hypothetical protein [Bacillus cereus]
MLRKQKEKEKTIHLKAMEIAGTFYSFALLVCSVYDRIRFGHFGTTFGILLVGNMIFLCTRVYLNRAMK